ncbi:DUF3846 domain-containing protein [Pseudactinotalea sp. HY160]|uniref:DUF3846 domain-containing protein n=1 Tax=Pseudactinotalea sp. HY160 TaxID=2654490 RepID=UPI00128E8601|nr:DUF3846 domain-containing protein [Pseudactinotalea sp. HY160]MPV50120.1 DUF3846 domain-containing protein [Pseudactinotalea sp. HY160]
MTTSARQPAEATQVALRLDVDGSLTALTLPETGSSLKVLQRGVGGTVDVVGVRRGMDMWLHDEGLFIYEVNKFATTIAHELLDGNIHQSFHGPAVFTGVDGEGDTVGLSVPDAKYLASIVADMVSRLARG